MTGRSPLTRAARLCAVLAVPLLALAAAPVAAQTQTVTIVSIPLNFSHYVAGNTIRARVTISAGIISVSGGTFAEARMSLDIGGVTRQARPVETISNPVGQLYVDFAYTVTADDFDTNGVSIPANAVSGPTWGDQGGNLIDRNNAALPAQLHHQVVGSAASISSTSPALLNENNLNTATVDVTLTGVTFGTGVAASSFELVTTMTGVTINSVSSVSSGDTSATLTLASTANISAAADLAVKVLAAAHSGGTDLTTGAVNVAPVSPLDVGPGITARALSITVGEGDSGFWVLDLSTDPGAACTAGLTISVASDDPAVTVSPATLTITSTNWTTAHIVTATVAEDDDNVVDETVTVSHTVTAPCPASGYTTALAISSMTVTVDDNDTALFSIDSPRVAEGGAGDTPTMTFTVTLSPAASAQATVLYHTSRFGDTAGEGTDFVGTRGGLTFAPGETSKTFPITVTGDATVEPDETFTVTLTDPAPSGFVIATGRQFGTGTIVDDDRPTLTIDSPRVAEGDSGTTQLVFTVTLSPASTGQVTVSWTEVTGGTATSGTDYTALAGGTLTFAAGETSKTIPVDVRGDSDIEPDETVRVRIDSPNPSGTPIRDADGAIAAFAVGVGTIDDDDGTTWIDTVAGTGTTGSSGDGGAATSARLHSPDGVTLDSADNLYIADRSNHRIRRVDASGNISTFAGTGSSGFSGDGGQATAARLFGATGVALDRAGNLYIADATNHRIRRVDPLGVISTVAGTGTSSFGGDGGQATAAQFSFPLDIAVDGAGNLYIADNQNHRIRRVDTSGNISTVAGTGTAGFGGDGGPANAAMLDDPIGVALDSAGNLYIADQSNHRIRRVDASGNISTVAGAGTGGFSGDGGPATAAELDNPQSVALDGAGNLYIADTNNHRIRKVDPSGTISTIAGTGTGGFGGDGGPAIVAQINNPGSIAVDGASRYVYVADTNNHRVRRIAGVAEPAPPEEEEDGQGGGGGGPVASLPDPGLQRAVAQALGKAPGSVTEADLRALTSLNADSFGVTSLAGLEAALNLEWLTLSGNAPAAGDEPLDLSPVAGLPSLTYLDLSDNALVDVSDLSRLTSLRTLLLGGNAIRDLSPLSGLTGLEALTLSGNGLADVSALSTLTALEQLWLDGNDLSDISALSALGSLIYLHLGDNRIADISPLAGLSALRRLWLPNNMVADVSALAGLRALTRLDLSRNRIADASPLRGLPRLSWLRLGWNRLAGVSRLAGHPKLADGGALGLRGNPLGAAALATHIPALREAGAAVVFGWAVPLFPSAADAAGRSGVARVLNRSDMAGMVLVEAVDEAGEMSGPATLSLAAGAAAQFDSADLENGNAEMGLAEGLGPPTRGSWRLLLWSVLDIEVLAYLRTPDGFLTAAHAELPRTGDSLSAFLFNPASNRLQRSSLRVFNPGAESARMSVWGVDDAGRGRFASGFMAPPNAPLALSAGRLERSRGAAGAGLGNGAGKWRLRVAAPWPLSASTFLESPSGHVSNLSPPPLRAAAGEMLRLPLFPAASNPAGREGFARVANMTAAEGMVDIEAVDDAGVRAGPVRLQLAARATMHFNSDDLENGNAKKGLASGVGAPTRGAWRLELRSGTLPLAAAGYARHADGFVTSLHETAPAADGAARVPVFHPASSDEQRSLLRLANNGEEPALATITGVDDAGAAAEPVTVTVPAGEALTLTAAQLEDGGEGLEGALGDGDGKWRLTVEFDNPLTVMSLMESPAGHLSNLSATARP